MKSAITFIIFIMSFSGLSCSENFIKPNIRILTMLRDELKVKNIEKTINELSIGRNRLSVNRVLEHFADLSSREQILEFEKYIRKTVDINFKNSTLLNPAFSRGDSRALYEVQLSVLYNLLFEYKNNMIKPQSRISDLVEGEEFYYVFDSYDSTQMITLDFYSDGAGVTPSYVFEPHLVSANKGVVERFRQPAINFKIEQVSYPAWKGGRFKLFRFILGENTY